MSQHDDREAQARKRRADQLARQDKAEINSAIQHMLTRTDGRKFLWWLLQIGFIGANPFRGAAREQTDFNCGVLNVGLQVQASIIEANPSGYLTMQQENEIEQRKRTEYINNGGSSAAGQPGGYDHPDAAD